MTTNKIKKSNYRHFYLKVKKLKSCVKTNIDDINNKDILTAFTQAKKQEIANLTLSIQQYQAKLAKLNEQYLSISTLREQWMEKANMLVSPDGKLKSLRKMNKIGRKKSQKLVRKMIVIAEKMQELDNKINLNQKIIHQINNETFVPLSKVEKIKEYWKSIPYDKQQKIWGTIFCLPWVIGFILFFLLPLSTTIWWSLNKVTPDKGKLIINWVGLGNYISLFKSYVGSTETVITQVLVQSTGSLILNLIIVMIFSLIMAVFLNTKFKGNGLVKAIFFIPVIFNSTAIMIAMDGLGARLDSSMAANFAIARQFTELLRTMSLPTQFTEFLVSTVGRIFSIVNMSGVQILIFLAAIQSVPTSLYEAAKMEGATKYEMFWKITFPMVTPIFLTAMVYTIVDGFARSPLLSFMASAESLSKYGISSAIAIIYFLVNFLIIGIFYLLMKSGVFYYDKK